MALLEHIGTCDWARGPQTTRSQEMRLPRLPRPAAHRAVEDGKGLPGRVRIGGAETSAVGVRPAKTQNEGFLKYYHHYYDCKLG